MRTTAFNVDLSQIHAMLFTRLNQIIENTTRNTIAARIIAFMPDFIITLLFLRMPFRTSVVLGVFALLTGISFTAVLPVAHNNPKCTPGPGCHLRGGERKSVWRLPTAPYSLSRSVLTFNIVQSTERRLSNHIWVRPSVGHRNSLQRLSDWAIEMRNITT